MNRIRFITVVLVVALALTLRFRGLLVGLSILVVFELFGLLVGLEGPGRSRGPSLRRFLPRLPDRLALAVSSLVAPVRFWLAGLLPGRWYVPGADFGSYERILSEIGWAGYSGRDFDVGLRRRLRESARVRLEAGYGIDPDREDHQARARELLGELAWTRLGFGQPVSSSRATPGVDRAEIEHIVSAIERLGPAHPREGMP